MPMLTDFTDLGRRCPRRPHLERKADMAERNVTTPAGVGLHARPAAMFARAAAKAPIDVTVARPGGAPVNAKSILAVLSLDVRGGEEVVLRAEGDGAETVLADLVSVLSPAEEEHG